ncbi:DNA replication protein DnaC [Alicyclobacillus macrosporangiidus]|uniref:DNA replication protein DnaC n=1 Tax=Alicyclobacillus macrosporangiidus TaxID=392015 RepID=A0A1I7IC35_9BACL|nr:DNA replication protein DnaC [Alicyclobacillus macrosporangiidus]
MTGMLSKSASSGADKCPHCGCKMRRMTTVKVRGKEYPWGPLVCDCEGFKVAQDRREAERKAREEAEERERQRERIEQLFRTSGLPARWRNRTFEAFQVTDSNREAFEVAKQYADWFDPVEGRGLLLTGTVGTGKTHLAAAIAMELIARGHWVVFGTITSLLQDIRRTYDEHARETEADVLRRLKRCALLIIDDLGKENVSPWVKQTVFDVVNARYEDNKALIVTTNLSLPVIRQRYNADPQNPNDTVSVGDALVDRILEMCKGVRMVGESWRKRSVL